jgi:hypothetical protein
VSKYFKFNQYISKYLKEFSLGKFSNYIMNVQWMKGWKMNVHEWTSSMMMLTMVLAVMLMMMLDMMIFMSFTTPYIIYLVKLNYNFYLVFLSPTSWSSHFCLVLSHILENKLHKLQQFIFQIVKKIHEGLSHEPLLIILFL